MNDILRLKPGLRVIALYWLVWTTSACRAWAHTRPSAVTGDEWGGATWSAVLMAGLIAVGVIVTLVVAAIRATRTPRALSPEDVNERLSNSKFVKVKPDTIIRNMRAGNEDALFLAMQDIAALPHYRDDVISEVALAIAQAGTYRGHNFMDSSYRCRLSRFLHMMLERNRMFEQWQVDCIRLLPFEFVASDCSCCESVAPRDRWGKRFWREIARIGIGTFQRRAEKAAGG